MKITNYDVSMSSEHSALVSSSLSAERFESELKTGAVPKVSKDKQYNYDEDMLSSALTNSIMSRLYMENIASVNEVSNFEYVKVEKEELSFQTDAVVTAGDKEYNIDINVNLKRSFAQKYTMSALDRAIFMDPLMISLNNDMPGLSEKSFSFDIDSDGTSDQISLLANNTAFLALDKNENGVIDDGSELFGAKSGDGFSELAVYDKDGNNWIDENDEIFDKLRIWQKNENGEDKLVGLGEVGIGAIFLGNAQTEFDINSLDDNSSLGKMRSSGFFLKENGESGIISQVDLAVQDEEKTSLASVLGLQDIDSMLSESSLQQKTNPVKTLLEIFEEYIAHMQEEMLEQSKEDRALYEAQIAKLQQNFLDLKSMQI